MVYIARVFVLATIVALLAKSGTCERRNNEILDSLLARMDELENKKDVGVSATTPAPPPKLVVSITLNGQIFHKLKCDPVCNSFSCVKYIARPEQTFLCYYCLLIECVTKQDPPLIVKK